MDIRELFLKQKQFVREQTRQMLPLLRPDSYGWRPAAGALSVGQMLRHVWKSEEGVRRVALEGDFAYYEVRIPQGLGAVLGGPGTLAEELAALEHVHAETLEAAGRYPLDRWEEVRAHEPLGFRRPVYAILFGIIGHEIHHRAQLMTYLRLLGTPVPEPFARR